MFTVQKDGYIHLFVATLTNKNSAMIVITDEMGKLVAKRFFDPKKYPPGPMIGVVACVTKIIPRGEKIHVYISDPIEEWAKGSKLLCDAGCIVEYVDKSINLAQFVIDDVLEASALTQRSG